MFFFVFYCIGFWYYQPYFLAINIETKYFGVIFALFNIVATITARYADKYVKATKGKSMIMLSILLAVSFIGMGIIKIPIGFILILLQQITRGVNMPVFMKFIQKHIPSNKRATIISINSLLKNLSVAIVFPLAGLLMDSMSIIDLNLYWTCNGNRNSIFYILFK